MEQTEARASALLTTPVHTLQAQRAGQTSPALVFRVRLHIHALQHPSPISRTSHCIFILFSTQQPIAATSIAATHRRCEAYKMVLAQLHASPST